MLEAKEQKILSGMLSEMGKIANAVPKEVFTNKEADSLVVLQRRLPESDLKQQLLSYNEIFGRGNGASIQDISNCMIAYIRIKVLVEAGLSDFDGLSYRALIKECRNQIDKTTNIIRLSKANAFTAEEFQKERIEKAIRKNEAFISCFENEIKETEKLLERIPLPEDKEEEITEREESKEQLKTKKKRESVISHIVSFLRSRQEEREVSEQLRIEEKKQAKTLCEEIPYYESRLYYTQCLPCKDLRAYCILKKKDNVYFGLKAHVKKGFYDNKDQSLMELTNISDEFVQLMTEDVLNGEFKLSVFSQEEKKSMQIYLDFIITCFEKHIGVTLSAQEYLNFKAYYNRLVETGMQLEKEANEKYYRALPLAGEYVFYMNSYNLLCSENAEDIAKQISMGYFESYVENLSLILESHVIDEGSKNQLLDLMQKIQSFLEPEIYEEEAQQEILISEKNFENVSIKIQIKNEDADIIDEAVYASSNLRQAVYDYMKRKAFIKKIGLVINGKEIFLYGAKEGTISVFLMDDKKKEIRCLLDETQSQILDFYVEQMKKIMTDYVEEETYE